MPNILYLWDFEDGTTQGWTLGPYSTLDDSGALQGTYSIKMQRNITLYEGEEVLVAKIDGIDLSTATKPMLVSLVKMCFDGYYEHRCALKVVVKDPAGSQLLSVSTYLNYELTDSCRIKVPVFDLSSVAGQSNLTIELYLYAYSYVKCGNEHYFDMIAIIDGADYEYNIAVLAYKDENRTIDFTIPSPDNDISALSIDGLGISLATPPWFGDGKTDRIVFIAETDQGNTYIDSTQGSYTRDGGRDNIKHTNYIKFTATPTYFNKVSIEIDIRTLDLWYSYDEKIVVVFLSGGSYARIYAFNIKFTINGISPTFATALHTTTYGTAVSGQKDYKIRIHANSLDVAIKVKFLVGDNTVINVGSVSFEVWDTEFTTQYGSGSVDLTTGTEITSAFATGIPVDTDLILRIKWNINASARVVLMVTPIFRVS